MSLRTLANVLLAAAFALLAVAAGADTAGSLGSGARNAVAAVGLALLVVSQAVRAYLDRTPRPLLVLAIVVGLLAFLLLDR